MIVDDDVRWGVAGVGVGDIADVQAGPALDLSVEPETAAVPQGNWMAGGFDMVGRLFFKRLSRGKVPQWQRLALHAWANVRRDGHCPMSADDLRSVLGKVPRDDKLKDAIRMAVAREWLAPGSNPKCLVVPYDVRYLTTRNVHSHCDRH